MKYKEAPNMPFDYVQGLHLVKREQNEIKYEVYLDVSNQGDLYESVRFDMMYYIDISLPDKILNQAKQISDNIVFLGTINA